MLVLLVGCGRIGFTPVATSDGSEPGDGDRDGTADDGGVPACRTDSRYQGAAGLASTYRVVPANLSWSAAKADCELDGAHLPIVDDAVEAASPLIGDWIGITDAVVEGEWRTLRGDLATFLPWATGEPGGGTGENCGRLDDAIDRFADRNCTDQRDYSCECE